LEGGAVVKLGGSRQPLGVYITNAPGNTSASFGGAGGAAILTRSGAEELMLQ
jgi:hypothetical protein